MAESVNKIVNQPTFFKVNHTYPMQLTASLDCENLNILSCTVKAFKKSCEYQNQKLKINARAIFNVIHQNPQNEVGVYESGADFSFDIENPKITADNLFDLKLFSDEVSFSKSSEGALNLTAVIVCDCVFYEKSPLSFLCDIPSAIVKSAPISALNCLSSCNLGGEIQGESLFNYQIEKVLCHDSQLLISSTTVGMGEVLVDGEIITQLLILQKSGQIVSEKIQTEIHYQIECDCASPQDLAISCANFTSVNLKIEGDENGEGDKIVALYELNFNALVFEQTPVNCVIDGFSVTNELFCSTESINYLTKINQTTFTHKCFGEGAGSSLQGEIVGVINCFVNVTEMQTVGSDLNLGGVISCAVLTKNQNQLQENQVSLPFSAQVQEQGGCERVIACAQKVVARNLDGKCLMECELAFSLFGAKSEQINGVCAYEIGEERLVSSSAISVLFIQKGDDLWTVCKKALASEQNVLADNPNVTFPATSDSTIVVYKKI